MPNDDDKPAVKKLPDDPFRRRPSPALSGSTG